MVDKQKLLNQYKDKYQYTFNLAWSRFLTYDELMKYDQPEVYDAEVAKGKIKSKEDWDNLVIPYTEDNIKKALCIAINRAITYFISNKNNSFTLDSQYFDDIKTWLYILEDKSFNNAKNDTRDHIREFYTNVSKKYKFEISV